MHGQNRIKFVCFSLGVEERIQEFNWKTWNKSWRGRAWVWVGR